MPEIVEPKQLIQSRVLVKRARLTVKRGAARPNGKSKPPQFFYFFLFFLFYCIAELAIKPCRSSRSKTRGGLRNSMTLAKETKHDKTNNKTQAKQPKHQHKQTKTRQVSLDGETGGEKE